MRPFIQLVPLVGLLLSTLVVEGSPIHYVTKTITVEMPADFTHSSTSAFIPPPAEVTPPAEITPSTTTTVIEQPSPQPSQQSSQQHHQQQQQPEASTQSTPTAANPATTSLEPANIPLSSATLIPPPANIPQIAN